MPRRHRSARDRNPPPTPRMPTWMAPPDAQAEGYTVRQVTRSEREYLCPGCNQKIPVGTNHVVVFEEEQPDLRRHWHTPCWRQEVRRLR